MALNAAQVAVLKSLADGPKETTNKTTKTTVSGAACWGLSAKGLVKVTEKKGVRTKVASITPAGRKALKDLAKPAKPAKKAAAKKAA